LASFESREPLVRSFDTERLAFGEWVFKLSASEINQMNGNNSKCLSVSSWVYTPLKRPDHAAYLRILRNYARNAAEPYAPGDAGFGDKMFNAVPRYCILTRMLVPTLSLIKATFTAMIAQTRVTRAGLAAIRFKQ
jgi:hypothetical protein